MGGAGPCAGRVGHGIPHEQFLFLKVSCKHLACARTSARTSDRPNRPNGQHVSSRAITATMFQSLPLAIRPRIQATEARLDAIYKAASMGLKGDSLALASGMLPLEYRQLCQFDPLAELAAQKGKADNELRAAQKLNEASDQGDAKASLAILQHVHGWTARQEISVDVYL